MVSKLTVKNRKYIDNISTYLCLINISFRKLYSSVPHYNMNCTTPQTSNISVKEPKLSKSSGLELQIAKSLAILGLASLNDLEPGK